MSYWAEIDLDEQIVDELQTGLGRVVLLGAEVAVVRLDAGELIAAAERPGWMPRRHPGDGRVFSQRLWRGAALGVFARRDLDEFELERVAEHLRHVLRWGVREGRDGIAS